MESKEEKTSEDYGSSPHKFTPSDSGNDSDSSSELESQSSESSHGSLKSSQDDHQGSSKIRKIDSGTFPKEVSSNEESDTESDLRSVEDNEEGIRSSRSPIHSQTYKGVDPEMFMDDNELNEDGYVRSHRDY